MPISIPPLDERRYQQLLNEVLARIPAHTPEWTNTGPSDPGRTLLELFCFLHESILYRADQVPERNRRKFLQLLGLPLQAAQPASGIVSFSNSAGSTPLTLNAGLELRAGSVPFRTLYGLDLLPLQAQVYYKRAVPKPEQATLDYYKLLYASYNNQDAPANFSVDLYETTPLQQREPDGIDLAAEAVDASLWLALLAPPNVDVAQVRKNIAGKTLSVGLAPVLDNAQRTLLPNADRSPDISQLLRFELPQISDPAATPVAAYAAIEPRPLSDIRQQPGVVELTLPDEAGLQLWQNLDPLEAGVGEFPPALDDPQLEARLVTWLRIRAVAGAQIKLLWAGINACQVSQRIRVFNEVLAPGTGQPEQTRPLAQRPLIPGSIELRVAGQLWQEIDDLLGAGPEVPQPDWGQPPGSTPPLAKLTEVCVVDYEAGLIKFGDGVRYGKRPPAEASISVSYDICVGAAGNVAAGSIKQAPALPSGIAVSNPIRSWGGADAESVADGEKQVARFLQHRERLVTAEDFATIARRAPGIDIGRLEVLPAFHPELSPNEPGDAPGVVTLLVLPKRDPAHPSAPQPDRLFLNALCRHLDPRRLVTTELVLRGPIYVPIWLSIGIDIKTSHAVSEVREAVKQRLLDLLAPIYPQASSSEPGYPTEQGWPLRKDVLAQELLAEASRVPGVLLVNEVLLAQGNNANGPKVPIVGLQLPQVLGISVQVGNALPLDALRGQPAEGNSSGNQVGKRMPVPFVPAQC
ncbi:MAG: baseplate J/gp47 family protein [Chitinivorax sp.]